MHANTMLVNHLTKICTTAQRKRAGSEKSVVFNLFKTKIASPRDSTHTSLRSSHYPDLTNIGNFGQSFRS